MNHLGKDLKNTTVILKEEYYNGSESVRTFKCKSGSGCSPDSVGNGITGTFADGEKGRIESYEVEKTKEQTSSL
ncbi:MAG: hypothetical protein ABFR82_12315 [Nitrospirota bacterium]